MNTNQKVIQLLERIMSGSKGYCGDHYVYTPQLEADSINKLHAELISESTSQPEAESRCPKCGETEPVLCCENCGHTFLVER